MHRRIKDIRHASLARERDRPEPGFHARFEQIAVQCLVSHAAGIHPCDAYTRAEKARALEKIRRDIELVPDCIVIRPHVVMPRRRSVRAA